MGWFVQLITALFSFSCFSETVRVTTRNLQEMATGDLTRNLEITASSILKTDPDIIILQQVRDWKMCLQLADALKPSLYYVLVCSAFHDAQTRTNSDQQAAILSKRKAYFALSEPWQVQGNMAIPGGFVSADRL